MNIFVVSPDAYECAKALDDKRLIKMVLETAQLLSSAARLNGYSNITYKLTHKHHPCTKWVSSSNENYTWLYIYFTLLLLEYKFRFNKEHKCSKLTDELANVWFLNNELTPFPNCTSNKEKNISFKHIEDVYKAYKMYLNARWKTDKFKPKWTNRIAPSWANYNIGV